MKKTLLAATVAATLVSGYSQAAVINLYDVGGVTGSKAEQGFQIAADFWGKMLTNDVQIDLSIRFAALAPNVIGSTGSRKVDQTVADWQAGFNATKSNSIIDQTAILPTLTGGGVSGNTAGVNGTGNNDNSITALLDGSQISSQVLYQNSAVIKAVGGTVTPGFYDGSMTFSSTFAFDFNPLNGIKSGSFDFIGVAIHEMGHALGFVSGVDYFDYYGTGGPGYGILGYDLNDTAIFSALDMFRYSAPGTLDFQTGGNPYFSIDGGQTALLGNTFSTGSYNGDGRQASHWKDEPFCGAGLGIMDPTFCYGQMGVISGLDLAAYDAMGWNLSVDALTFGTKSTFQIYAEAVPEPTTWALMLGALGGLVGLNRRKKYQVK